MEEKYIELLLKRCLNFKKSKSLFINYDIVNQDFVDKLILKAEDMGVSDIYLDKKSIYKQHDILKKIKLEDIENCEYFDNSNWDEYAKKDANFLILDTEFPGVMDDIDSDKIARAVYVNRKSKPIYKKKQMSNEIPWCIAALPNELWAKHLFKNCNNSYNLLLDKIYKICMIDTKNSIESWNKYIENNQERVNKLNNLKLKLIHYKNNLGTDLIVEFMEDTIWCDASGDGLVNMPSYEIFTSPNYTKTNGIVYSSKLLNYNGGVVDKFWIKFKDGKAIDCGAEIGADILKEIINSDSNSCYLGECALVQNNSPISNTGIVFGTTLIDENASCHLALGEGFKECIKGGFDLSDEELLKKGVNASKTHVDFMIGTPDLEILGETYDNEKVKIFENGNFKI